MSAPVESSSMAWVSAWRRSADAAAGVVDSLCCSAPAPTTPSHSATRASCAVSSKVASCLTSYDTTGTSRSAAPALCAIPLPRVGGSVAACGSPQKCFSP